MCIILTKIICIDSGDLGMHLGRSDGKESACSAGDPGSIPGSGKSLDGRHDNPLQYFAWRIPWTEEPGRLQSMR